MKRRRLYHFKNLLADGISFYDFHAVTDSSGNRGTSYLLSQPLTSAQADRLKQYDNVIITTCGRRFGYGARIQCNALILMK